MFREGYLPTDVRGLTHVEPLCLVVRIISARHLSRKSVRGMVSPFVEVEIVGADYDNAKFKTKTISDNGFNPVWEEVFNFKVQNPDLALLR